MLQVENLVKTFDGPDGTVRALDGVSLSVGSGEMVAVRGPSGCGKTTLLLAAGALLRPSEGSVRLDGEDPYALDPDARARWRGTRVGFVFQQFYLVPYLTVLENILTPSLAVAQPGSADRAHELLDQFGLGPRARHVPAELSVGERQRTALARALLNRPALLLADEPTGNLDDANAETVLGHLAGFAEDGGAVLVVSHDARVGAYARRTLDMAEGAMAASSEA